MVFIIEHAKGCVLVVYGSARLIKTLASDKERVDISGLANGVYSVVITDGLSIERTARRLVKVQ